jgi:hypothetical protein
MSSRFTLAEEKFCDVRFLHVQGYEKRWYVGVINKI